MSVEQATDSIKPFIVSDESVMDDRIIACPTYSIYSLTNIVINSFKDKTMTIQKQITDVPIDPNALPINIKVTPVNIILPQRLPQRDDNVWIASPVKTTPQ
jgi:hypothetical protein